MLSSPLTTDQEDRRSSWWSMSEGSQCGVLATALIQHKAFSDLVATVLLTLLLLKIMAVTNQGMADSSSRTTLSGEGAGEGARCLPREVATR